jgi:hypothetical protein
MHPYRPKTGLKISCNSSFKLIEEKSLETVYFIIKCLLYKNDIIAKTYVKFLKIGLADLDTGPGVLSVI